MAVTVSTQVNPVATKLVVDAGANSTAADNTTGGAGTLYMVEIDNSADSATIVYFKMVDAATTTPGTTVASMVLMVPASVKLTYAFPTGIAFSTGFSHWCVKEAAVAGATNPDTGVVARYLTS